MKNKLIRDGDMIETGPGMLYMVGKIFMYKISFNIVYELIQKNMKHFEYFFFPTEFRKSFYFSLTL